MRALIDADTLCYAAAAMAEGIGEGIGRYNVDQMVSKLLRDLDVSDHTFYVTGDKNFRYAIYPEYKANRLKTIRPEHLAACRDHLMMKYGAVCSDGCEADDLLGVEQTAALAQGRETMISTIDKDLDMIAGWHYRPEIKRKGVIVTPWRRYYVEPYEADRFFFKQLITGDPTDNIKGIPGVGKDSQQVAELMMVNSYEEMEDLVLKFYDNDDAMLMNGQVLWIWRKMDDIWQLKSGPPLATTPS